MLERLENIFRLGVKELYSLRRDTVLLALVAYAFSFGIYGPASGTGSELHNATIAIADEDRSALSYRIADAFLKPSFKMPQRIAVAEIDSAMDTGRFTFVIDIPPNFERDVLAGKRPTLQVNVDATAMQQAGIGAGYIQSIISDEITGFVTDHRSGTDQQVGLVVRVKFNPNLTHARFASVMQLITNVTMLAIILTGAALIREREQGTIEHLLVMPLTPFEIMMAKVWSSGLVILIAVSLSLWLVIRGLLQVPITGSVSLFMVGTVLYLFSATAIGIFLGTVARSMQQLGLLFFMLVLPMNLLSGGSTPQDSMPDWLQNIMQLMPSTHFVSFAQAILYRGAGLEAVWLNFLAIVAIGTVFFLVALARFRKTITTVH